MMAFTQNARRCGSRPLAHAYNRLKQPFDQGAAVFDDLSIEQHAGPQRTGPWPPQARRLDLERDRKKMFKPLSRVANCAMTGEGLVSPPALRAVAGDRAGECI